MLQMVEITIVLLVLVFIELHGLHDISLAITLPIRNVDQMLTMFID